MLNYLLCNYIPEGDFNSVRNKVNSIENLFCADGFLGFILTQGDTPSSFALGYKYSAHTGLNPGTFSFPQLFIYGLYVFHI